jgi:predicted RNA binding protein YcfA (HicA-like mRNA interferase family)
MRVAERRGWVLERIRGDHFVYRHPDIPGNLSITSKREMSPGTLRTNIATMRMTVDEFLAALKD